MACPHPPHWSPYRTGLLRVAAVLAVCTTAVAAHATSAPSSTPVGIQQRPIHGASPLGAEAPKTSELQENMYSEEEVEAAAAAAGWTDMVLTSIQHIDCTKTLML